MPNEASAPIVFELLDVHPFYMEPDSHFEKHTHAHHELVIVQRGRLKVQINTIDKIASPGDILLYPSGVSHEEWVMDNEPVLTFACTFQSNNSDFTKPLFCHDVRGRIQELIAKLTLKFLMHLPHERDPELCRAILTNILEEVRHLAARTHETMVEKVREFVIDHIDQSFTLDDLAATSGLSKYHFVRQYRAITGKTPMDDARHIRLEQARRLLMTTNLPLYEIGPMVGIPDVPRLSRLLKTHLNVSARELRQITRHDSPPTDLA